MNVSALTGRLVKDPELRTTATSGKNVTSFTIAVTDPDNKDKTDFIDCVAWEGSAEFLCKYFRKGQKVEVTGKLKTRVFEKDGAKNKRTELVVKNIGFGESKKEGGALQNSDTVPDASESGFPDEFQSVNDDDLPF